MTKKIIILKDIPFTEGKIYSTKFATGELFLLKEIIYSENKINGISSKRLTGLKGVYQNSPHLGICPISPDRLIPETEFNKEIEVCSKCNEPIKSK